MTAKSQIGIAEESVFGTYVAPTRFHELLREGVVITRERIESQAWRSGQRVASAERTKPGRRQGGGPIELELPSKGAGLLLKHLFGSVATTTPGGGVNSRDHTFKLGDLEGLSLTYQAGREDRAGTVRAFSYTGCKVTRGTFRCALGEWLRVETELLPRDVTTAEALATASYPTGLEGFTFVEGSLTVEGNSVGVRSFDLTVDNRLNADDFAFGSALRRDVPEPALREVTGNFDLDFDSLDEWNLYANATVSTLVLLFEGSTIEGALKYGVQITAECVFNGTDPTTDGPEESRLPMPFKIYDPEGATEPIELRYRTTDTSP